MNKPLAIKATYANLKFIQTRGVIQLVMEVPVHDQAAVMEVLDGFPQTGEARWFAIAPLRQEALGSDLAHSESNVASSRLPSQTKRSFRDLPPQQQAGIRCNEMSFSAFLSERHADMWSDMEADPVACVRAICCVGSRSELETNHKARVIWKQLNDQFEAWQLVEHVR